MGRRLARASGFRAGARSARRGRGSCAGDGACPGAAGEKSHSSSSASSAASAARCSATRRSAVARIGASRPGVGGTRGVHAGAVDRAGAQEVVPQVRGEVGVVENVLHVFRVHVSISAAAASSSPGTRRVRPAAAASASPPRISPGTRRMRPAAVHRREGAVGAQALSL